MMHSERQTFHRLRDSRSCFEAGVPILTYHKLGRRPRRAKWRSLYLHHHHFARQMRELARAGYATTRLADFQAAAGNPEKKFVVTFDDGYENSAAHSREVLGEHGFTAVQFLVAGHIGGINAWDVAEGEVPERLMDYAGVLAWLAAGHEIGAHTISHPRLTRLSRREQREEIRGSKQRLEDLFGVPVNHFCYPYGDYDAQVAEEVVSAGYTTACTHRESGVNTETTSLHSLLRMEARYPKRNLKTVVTTLWSWWRSSLKAS